MNVKTENLQTEAQKAKRQTKQNNKEKNKN